VNRYEPVLFFDTVKSHAVIALASFVYVPAPETVIVPASDQSFCPIIRDVVGDPGERRGGSPDEGEGRKGRDRP